MLKSVRSLLACLLVLALPIIAVSSNAAGTSDGMPKLLVMAAIHEDPKSLHLAMQPMADYMATKLAPIGVESIEVLVVDNREQMVRLLRDRRVDWITETAYSAAVLQRRAGTEILVRKWKYGVADYRSLVFARKDQNILDLDHLSNRRIAFQHPGSTSGYFVAASALMEGGHQLEELGSLNERPSDGALGYLFSGAEYNSVIWVHKGLVDAGVISTGDWRKEAVLPEAIRDDLRIIYTSRAIPRALELVRGDLHPEVKAAMKQVLLSAHLDPKAEAAMAAYHRTTRFDELDESGHVMLRLIDQAVTSESAAAERRP